MGVTGRIAWILDGFGGRKIAILPWRRQRDRPIAIIAPPTIAGSPGPGDTAHGVTGTYAGDGVSVQGRRWAQYVGINRDDVYGTGLGASYAIPAASPDSALVYLEDLADANGNTAVAVSAPLDIAVTPTLPEWTSNPKLSGSGKVGSPLTLVPAVATLDPAYSNEWYFDGALSGSVTGISYTPVTADKAKKVKCRTKAVKGGHTIYSAYTAEITITEPATGTVINVANPAELQAALNGGGASGAEIRLASGTFDDTVAVSNKTYASEVTITAQDLGNLPIFTKTAFSLTNVNRFRIVGFKVNDSRRDNGRIQDTEKVAATSAKGMYFNGCSNYTIADCSFNYHHIGLDMVESLNAIVDSCTFTRCGMDNIRVYQSHENLILRNLLIWDTLIYEPDSASDDARHPDGIQFAVNFGSNGHQTPPKNVLVENCYIESLQENGHMHGIFAGNAATRLKANGGGGYSLAEAGYSKITVRNVEVHTAHSQGICWESVRTLLIDRCWLHRSAGEAGSKTPQVAFLRDMFEGVTIRDTTAQKVPGSNQGLIPSGQLTTVNYKQSASPPSGFVALVPAGAGKNVGNRLA